jgi:hypothetical protein
MRKFLNFILVVIFLQLLSCKETNENFLPENVDCIDETESNALISETLNYDEASSDSLFVQLTSEFGILNKNELVLKSGNSKIKKLIKVNLSKINKLKLGPDNTSFTILVDSLNFKTLKYTNLVLEKKQGKTRAYLVDYYPTRMWVADYISGIVSNFDGKIGITKINLEEYSLKSTDCEHVYYVIDYLCPCHGHSVDDNCSCYILPTRKIYDEVVCFNNGEGGIPTIPQPPVQTTSGNYSQGTPEGATGTRTYNPSDNSGPDPTVTSALLPYDNSNIGPITLINDKLGIELGEAVTDIPVKKSVYIDLGTFLKEGKQVCWDKSGGFLYKCKGIWVYYRNGQYYVDQTGKGNWKKATLSTTRLSDELTTLLGGGVKYASKQALRYLTPVEDFYILLEGKDFDGLEQSRIVTSGYILLAVIPGTKLLKPTSKLLKAPVKIFVSNFADAQKLLSHFTKHAAGFGGKFLTKEAYANGAKNFFARAADNNILQYTRKGGDIVRYDIVNNVIGVCSKDGILRTFFKPSDGVNKFKTWLIRDYPHNGEKAFNEITKIDK